MDLKKFVPENDTITVTLSFGGEVLKNDDETDMTIELYLPHSKEYRKIRHAQTDKMIESKKERLKAAEAEELGISFLASTTKSWNITYGGEKPKCTQAKAKEVYDYLTWVPELLLDGVEKSKGFTKA